MACDNVTNKIIPVAHFLITSKTEQIYNKCLKELINISNSLNIKINPKLIYTDLKKA